MSDSLLNFWYGVELASALKDRPLSLTLLDRRYVIYRDSSGAVHAAVDRCPHRGASFSKGWIESDCLRCPYHGWSFNLQGQCVLIPADQDGVRIPSQARIIKVPVQEHSGLIWLFPGSPDQADPDLIPALPEMGNAGWYSCGGQTQWDANFSRVVESFLDHSNPKSRRMPRSSGYADWHVEECSVQGKVVSVSAAHAAQSSRRRDLLKFLVHGDWSAYTTRLTTYFPSVIRIDLEFKWKKRRFIYFVSNIPVSRGVTLTKWIGIRNFLTFPPVGHKVRLNTENRLAAKSRLVATQDLNPSWETEQADLLLSSDQLILAYRKAYQSLSASFNR
jgi:nitrite reductase/ring-hydroxylating ferredoxin subunit